MDPERAAWNVTPLLSAKGAEEVEARLLSLPQIVAPVTHHQDAPGVYMREILMPAGSVIIGHAHTTKHYNIVLTGRALVSCDDGKTSAEIVAPCVFVSEAGVRKRLYIVEEMRWLTVHPTKLTDLTKLEKKLIEKSPTHKKHMKLLQEKNA